MSSSAPPLLQTSPPLPPRTPPPPTLTIPSPANSSSSSSSSSKQPNHNSNTSSGNSSNASSHAKQPSIRVHSDPVYAHPSTSSSLPSKLGSSDSQLRASAEKYHLHGHHHQQQHQQYDLTKLKRSRSPIKLIRNIRTYFHGQRQKVSGNLKGSTFPSPLRPTSSYPMPHTSPPPSSLAGHSTPSTLSPLDNSNNSTLLGPNGTSARSAKSTASLDPEKQVLLLRVKSYFEHAGHPADEETAEYLLESYQWDIAATLQYCQDFIDAVQGTLVPVSQQTPLQGAVNDQMTSCYIDSLLFAMFARLSAFEGLLNVNLDGDDDSDSDDGLASAAAESNGGGGGEGGTGGANTNNHGESADEEQRQEALLNQHRLQTWLRMFVNQLRQGRLVQAHVVRELRQHLYSCGWSIGHLQDGRQLLSPHQLQAAISRQEDASELFMFLTEILHLPYLPLEQRLLHGARISDDDDKVITERMLQICIPSPEEQRQQAREQHQQLLLQQQDPVALQNAPSAGTGAVQQGMSLYPSTLGVPPYHPQQAHTKTRESRLARFLYPKNGKADKQHQHPRSPPQPPSSSSSRLNSHALPPPVPPRPPAAAAVPALSPSGSPELEILSLEKLLAQHFYDNTLTGIRRKISSGTGAPLSPGVEVPVSAWQVLELLPFYSSSNEQGQQVVASRRQYPGDVVILPLILKRYSFGMDGQTHRIGTPIEIPRRMDFSRFVNPGPMRSNSRPNEKSSLDQSSNIDSGDNKNSGYNNLSILNTNEGDLGRAPSYSSISHNAAAPVPTTPLAHSITVLQEEPESDIDLGPDTPTTPPPVTTTITAAAATSTNDTIHLPQSSHHLSPSSPLTVNTARSGAASTATSPLRKFSADKAGNFLVRTLLDSPTVPDTPPPQYSPSALPPPNTSNMNAGGDRKEWPLEEDNRSSGEVSNTSTAAAGKVRYFLELKSVVCHLGSRLDSGHYRSYVANGPPPPNAYDTLPHGESAVGTNGSGSASAVAEVDEREPDWLRHDDLDPTGQRVQLITHDSDANMEMESDWACNGYILFYELKAIRL